MNKKTKKTIENLDKRSLKTLKKIKERNKILSLIWINEHEFYEKYNKIKKSFKLKLQCKNCNQIFLRSVWTHTDTKIYNCPFCVGNAKLTFKKFLSQFLQKKINYFFWLKINEEWWKKNYKNTSTKIKLKCKKCKKELKIDINNLLYQNVKCKYCANIARSEKNQRILYKDFLKKAKEIHGNKYDYSLITEEWWQKNFNGSYRTTKIGIPIICKKHGKFLTTYSKHIHQGSGCPKCYTSKGEEKIMRFLEKNKINFIYQYKIQKYRYDFFLPDLKLLIEYDGKQHFQKIDFFGQENYEKTIKNDLQKTFLAKAYGLKLLRIDYTQFKIINSILGKNIKIFLDRK